MSRYGSLVPARDNFFAAFEQEFNKIYDEMFGNFFASKPVSAMKASAAFPKLNIYQTDDQLVMQFAVAGMKEEDLKIEISDENVLTVSGRMATELFTQEGVQYHVKELRGGSFERSIRLPDSVQDDPKATLEDGVLTLTWGTKPAEKANPIRAIPIQKRIAAEKPK